MSSFLVEFQHFWDTLVVVPKGPQKSTLYESEDEVVDVLHL